ncbi:hypothetical protein PDESU_00047 [Pontiella desulfatans]|uniref:Uncharacterized protein n=1 Tax=Pontiella desulfatans TaxID=2750659 RepID=A0A6C2TVB0_PONDE|nr:hypothetical protein [Pontiella desulfatans]VGO11503.1 hypothetical protein PDESU_00047 [Pontiella desulfatans]
MFQTGNYQVPKGSFARTALVLGFAVFLGALQHPSAFAAAPLKPVFPGADENTPSLSQYFSWINNTNEGSNEKQTLINLGFFEWLHDEYGMKLDIYAFDAGAIDGPRYYGSTESTKFKKQFPNGFGPIYEKAKSFGCRLGVWLGPDGFGDTREEEQERIDQLVGLCRDYEFQLFKMDAVCTQLRTNKQDALARLMTECRTYSPDLILLNHRLNLGDALPHATTFLWGGAETYIDVHMANWKKTGTHNRVQALSRGLVPDLKRLTEDHGVCISSCVDFWDDDLILQAFNRGLILAPEIYANPWFLRDDEFPKLARIYNLHRRYRDILVKGIVLPEEQYGPNAVARGDGTRRFITLRNLTWKPVTYSIRLDESIGLKAQGSVALHQFHPTEKFLAQKNAGESAAITVMPFRSCLLLATTEPINEVVLKGTDYEVVRDTEGKDILVDALGYPGTKATVTLPEGKRVDVSFPGTKINGPWHYKVGDLQPCEMPPDAEALYEATIYSTDNDPLEFRSLRRAGPTAIPQVQAARDAFVDQRMVHERGIDPAYLFDNDLATAYNFSRTFRLKTKRNIRLDFGAAIDIDQLLFILPDLLRTKETFTAEVSANLKSWHAVPMVVNGNEISFKMAPGEKIRYFRTDFVPDEVVEIEGYAKKTLLASNGWRISYLYDTFANRPPQKAFSLKFTLDEFVEGSYFCVALEGQHGHEGAYAALRVGDAYAGAPNRAPSYPVNAWEYPPRSFDSHNTYYIPITREMIGQPLELVVLAFDPENVDFAPGAWVTANPVPMVKQRIVLPREVVTASPPTADRFDPVIRNIEGWKVYVEPKLLDTNEGTEALEMLANHLQRISILLPPEQRAKMRQLEIWIESSHELGAMQYHPSVAWLESKGYDPRLANKVHIPRAEALLSRSYMIKQPAVILHELAHAYHNNVLDGGFDNPDVIETYDAAMAANLYDKALLFNGRTVRHYGATNHKEYFAEGTEAYLYRNDFYPFVAAELKIHDPALYTLMEKTWGSLK